MKKYYIEKPSPLGYLLVHLIHTLVVEGFSNFRSSYKPDIVLIQVQPAGHSYICTIVLAKAWIAPRMQHNGCLPSAPCMLRVPRTPSQVCLMHPNDAIVIIKMERSFCALRGPIGPSNTMKVHNPKRGSSLSTVTVSIWDSQAFCDLKKRGGWMVGVCWFNDGYDEWQSTSVENLALLEIMADCCFTPVKSTSWSSFDECKQVIKWIYKTQKLEKVLALHWEDIWQCQWRILQSRWRHAHPD